MLLLEAYDIFGTNGIAGPKLFIIILNLKIIYEKINDTDIKKEVVDLSISVAEKLINKNISEQDNSSLIEESLKKIKKYEA